MSDCTDPCSTALVTKEWAGGLIVGRGRREVFVLQEERQEVAARCLQGQPFGFTQEDVDALRDEAQGIRNNGYHGWEGLDSIAGRIAALLPPRP